MNRDHDDDYPTTDTVLTAVMVGAMALIGGLMIFTEGVQSVFA